MSNSRLSAVSREVKGHHVEAVALQIGRQFLGAQVVASGPGHLSLFGFGDGLKGRTEFCAPLRSDLDEDENRAVERDQVELAASGRVVAGEDLESLSPEKSLGVLLGGASTGSAREEGHLFLFPGGLFLAALFDELVGLLLASLLKIFGPDKRLWQLELLAGAQEAEK